MNWSNEWLKSKIDPGFEKEWQEHVDINGGINPVALGWKTDSQTVKIIEQQSEGKCITLSTIVNPGDFPTTVEAIQIGDLAVHHDIKCKKEGFWQVTHVPTLTRFNVVPHGLHKQADLIEWCKKVQAELPEDWKELASLTTDNYEGRSAAKDRIMVLCQGMKV